MDQLIQVVSAFVLGMAIIAPFLLKARQALKEIGELLVNAGEALDDGKLTLDEVKELISDIKEVAGVFKK